MNWLFFCGYFVFSSSSSFFLASSFFPFSFFFFFFRTYISIFIHCTELRTLLYLQLISFSLKRSLLLCCCIVICNFEINSNIFPNRILSYSILQLQTEHNNFLLSFCFFNNLYTCLPLISYNYILQSFKLGQTETNQKCIPESVNN